LRVFFSETTKPERGANNSFSGSVVDEEDEEEEDGRYEERLVILLQTEFSMQSRTKQRAEG